MKKENKVKNQIKKVFSSYFGPGYTGQLNLDIIINIIIARNIVLTDLSSKKERKLLVK